MGTSGVHRFIPQLPYRCALLPPTVKSIGHVPNSAFKPKWKVFVSCMMYVYITSFDWSKNAAQTPYRPYLNAQFSAAYDIYLEILHRVKQRHRAALNHDTLNWRMLNSCPACFYKLEDEPVLEFDWLVSIDGNNSLKRWNSTIYGSNPCIDSCKARSDYWINTCDVDRFKDEVQTREVRRASLHATIVWLHDAEGHKWR